MTVWKKKFSYPVHYVHVKLGRCLFTIFYSVCYQDAWNILLFCFHLAEIKMVSFYVALFFSHGFVFCFLCHGCIYSSNSQCVS